MCEEINACVCVCVCVCWGLGAELLYAVYKLLLALNA